MKKLGVGVMVVMLGSVSGWAAAQDVVEPMAVEQGAALPDRDQIYGFDIMTKDERKQYREQYEAIESDEDRRTFMNQHRQRMQDRARALGFGTPEQAQEMQKEGSMVRGVDTSSKSRKTGHGIHDYMHY